MVSHTQTIIYNFISVVNFMFGDTVRFRNRRPTNGIAIALSITQ